MAARLLARRGISVTLIEQHRFPRDKVCGECISALGWDVLARAGLAARVGAVRMTRGIVHGPSGRRAEIGLPGAMWGISRRVFDSFLLEAARAAGVTVVQPARCEGVEPGARPAVKIRNLQDNSSERVASDVVILADGKGATAGSRPRPTDDFGIKAHFELPNVARDAVQLFGVRGCYGGVAPIEGGKFNIALSVPRSRIERARDLETVFAEMVEENAGLRNCLDGGTRIGDWLAAPLPRFGVMRTWPQGVIPIGNAAAALEPIGGEGMGLALRSAEMAAEAIAECADVKTVQGKLRRQFQSLWRTRRTLWRAVALLISRPIFCELAVSVLNASDIGERVVRLGKESLVTQ